MESLTPIGRFLQLSYWKLGALKLQYAAEIVGEHYPVSEVELKNVVQLMD